MYAAKELAIGAAVVAATLSLGCRPARNLAPDPPPVVFQQPPALGELLAALDAQHDRVLDLQTDAARLTVSGYPGLRASLRLLRPRHMRLKATFMGNPVLDMGSNDERFWLWSSDSPVLFARHSQFAYSAAKDLLPVEPAWLLDALGLIHFDPQGPHQGPFQRDDGMIEVHTRIATDTGQRVRVVAVHPQYGYVTEVQMRGPDGRLLAIARADRHRYDEALGATLAHRVVLDLPASRLPIRSFTFEADSFAVNRLQTAAANPQLWTMPPGPSQDLADPRLQLALPAAPVAQAPSRAGSTADLRGYRPQFRGYQR